MHKRLIKWVNPFLEVKVTQPPFASPGEAGAAWDADARKGPSNHPLLYPKGNLLCLNVPVQLRSEEELERRAVALGQVQAFGRSIPWEHPASARERGIGGCSYSLMALPSFPLGK